MTDTALAHGPVIEKRRGEGLTAAALIMPATISSLSACWRRWPSCSGTA